METVATSKPLSGFWASVRESICGTEQDFTTGSINRAIFLLAIPMVLEMAMESLFAVVDVFWVSRLGSTATATVGLTESMLILVASVAMGLAMSTTAMVARRTGEKDPEGAAVAAVQAIALGVLVAVFAGAIGVFWAPGLLALMGGSGDLIRLGSNYARIILGGSATVVLLYLNNAIFRGAVSAEGRQHRLERGTALLLVRRHDWTRFVAWSSATISRLCSATVQAWDARKHLG